MIWIKIAIAWAFAIAVIVYWLRAATENEARLEEARRRELDELRRRVRQGWSW